MSAARAIGLLVGVIADGAVGDPRRRGSAAGGAALLALVAERAGRRRPLLRLAGTALGTWSVLGAARISAQGTELARDLETGDLDTARRTLSALDARRTDGLDVLGLSRASVENVAEATSDDVVAPLLWGAVAGVPGLLGSRAVALLRDAAERQGPAPSRLRWTLARLHELVNLVPTRVAAALTVSGAPVVGGSAGAAWRAWRRDTVLHPSPNAGRVEAAFAGALEIRLGGRTVYPHEVRELPVLGDGRNPDAGHVTRAVELSRVVGWLAGAVSAVLALLLAVGRGRGAVSG
ncbi:cobalamin biosynthesis protein CobD/CbiB [Prauserella muralis]|uniref:Cobalamin biosynthesis protein CobD n=1 Tax=Prauserella muralis TaxID=588067 RepID=A0A2V4BBG8_9PSEU|nr:cobalamin biosynthesis protein [Prauserella muralis]PXY32496.1 cobalamin biosynthesis protein [Prauserella muralis]TWE23802.1 adenosylcobinamide-phosphate synthase [Prauserella muralis]